MKALEVTAFQMISGDYFSPQNYQKASFNIMHLQERREEFNCLIAPGTEDHAKF